MENMIIRTPEDLKTFYLSTDITNISEVQSAKKKVNDSVSIPGKEKYIEALNAAEPSAISKAKRYNNMASGGGVKSFIMKNLGWILMVVFGVWIGVLDWDADTTWISLGFWVGVGVQIYISVLKSSWNKLTLNGTVIHPVVKGTGASYTPSTSATASVAADSEKGVFCLTCGQKNKEGAQFCEKCGGKLN